MTTTQDIINAFELYAGDSTGLSSTEELALVQKKYDQILEEHEWEFLRKTATGTFSTSVPYVSAPTDFRSFAKNYDQGTTKAVYVGTNYQPYLVIPMADRITFRNSKGYVYYDALNSRIYSTVQLTGSEPYEFDYIHVPAALTTGTAPIFPARYWDAIYHAMLLDNDIIQMSDKARSEYKENKAAYDSIMSKMSAWNSTIGNYDTYGIQ